MTLQNETGKSESGLGDSGVPGTARALTPPIQDQNNIGFFARLFPKLRKRKEDDLKSLGESVTIPEVVALIHFVSERGLDKDATIIKPLQQSLAAFQSAKTREARDNAKVDILVHYSLLCSVTYPDRKVNGRTLRHTSYAAWHMGWVIFWGAMFLILAVSTEIVRENFAEINTLAKQIDWQINILTFYKIALFQLSPFFYGGLGACIYLLKSLSEKAASSTFDARRLQGSGARIFLGAVFGFIVVSLIFDVDGDAPILISTGVGVEKIQQGAVAFMSGLGVKAIYGAFEKLVDTIDDKIAQIGKTPKVALNAGE